jgi:hypothetical protein
VAPAATLRVGAAEDHTVAFWRSTISKRPSAVSRSTPGESTSGLWRLATHTTVGPGMLAYQVPRYVLPSSAPGGTKKPSWKTPPAETSVWLPEMDAAWVMESADADGRKKAAPTTTKRRSARARALILDLGPQDTDLRHTRDGTRLRAQ